MWKKILTIVGVIGLIILVLVIVANMATSAALRKSNEFYNKIKSGNAIDAYSMFVEEAKLQTSPQAFDEIVKRVGPILIGTNSVVNKEVRTENGQTTGKIQYETVGTDGVVYNVDVALLKRDGEWKIMSFDSQRK